MFLRIDGLVKFLAISLAVHGAAAAAIPYTDFAPSTKPGQACIQVFVTGQGEGREHGVAAFNATDNNDSHVPAAHSVPDAPTVPEPRAVTAKSACIPNIYPVPKALDTPGPSEIPDETPLPADDTALYTACDASKSGHDTIQDLVTDGGQKPSGLPPGGMAEGFGDSFGPVNKYGHRVFGANDGPGIIRLVRPAYPERARRMDKGGAVLLVLKIDKDGSLRGARVLEPVGYGLDEAAMESVKNSLFSPATVNGRPVACTAELTIRFKPPGAAHIP